MVAAGDRLWFTPRDNLDNGYWLVVSRVGRRYYYFEGRPDIRGIIGLDGIVSAHIDTHYMGSVWKSLDAYQRARLLGGQP